MAVSSVISWKNSIAAALLALPVYFIGYMIYNVYFHPLRKYPGPKLWAASRLPWFWSSLNGRLHKDILELIEKYGQVIRIGPNELTYSSANAWKSIYGLRSVEMEKDLRGAGLIPTFSEHLSIISAPRHDHSRMRRTVAHAFSEKALREQEPLLESYISTLISRLKDKSADGPVDIVNWLNWTTFDIMGDLTYSSSFGCLKEGQYHEWVAQVFQSIKLLPFLQAALYYGVPSVRLWFAPKKLVEAKERSDASTYAAVAERISQGVSDRKDFMSYILRHNDEKGLTYEEIKLTAVILTIAGSETTATFMSGFYFLVLRHRRVYERLVREVRERFKNYEDITMVSTNELQYLPAVINEVFRLYPPVPCSFPRVVPEGGEVIEGQFVPGDTTVGTYQWCCNRDPRNFYAPGDFLPERFLDEKLHEQGDLPAKLFQNDQKNAVQPFSVGPRNCLGKNLAYGEIRLLASKLFFSFDMKLAADSDNDNWISRQSTYMLWEKPALNLELKAV